MWFGGISEQGRRAYNYIIKGIEEGLSGAEIMRILREYGLGYRLSDFYNDLRILKGETMKWETMKYVPKERIISERLYTPTMKAGERKFLTTFEIESFSPKTGRKYISHLAIGHDTPIRRSELEEEAAKTFYKDPELYDAEEDAQIISIKPVRGFVRV